MARIYNRDNINYSGLIGQAIQNANQTSQLYANKYQPWNTMGQGVSDVGNRLQEAGWKEFGSQQDDARAQAMQQRQFEQQEKMLQKQQEFQALESARARAQQIFTNTQNAQNAERLAAINKGYAAIDQYNDAQDKLSLSDERISALTAIRDKEKPGSTEWNKYNNDLNQEILKSINLQKRMDLALAQKNYADALTSGDKAAIAKAQKELNDKYPTSQNDQLHPAATQVSTSPTESQTAQNSVATEDSSNLSTDYDVIMADLSKKGRFKNQAEMDSYRDQIKKLGKPDLIEKADAAFKKVAGKETWESRKSRHDAKKHPNMRPSEIRALKEEFPELY